MLKTMRWTDNSMGSNFDYGWSDINQAFAAGTRRHVHQRLGRLHEPRAGEQHRPEHLRPGDRSRSRRTRTPACSAAARSPRCGRTRTPTSAAAAVKWIDFFYEQPLINKAQAIRNAKTLVASKQPVGVPALPVFNKAQYDLANTWIKPYINVPQAQMKPFTTGIFNQKLIPEPAASTQSVYHSLDAVVEAVLTDKNANIPQLLAAGEQHRPGADHAGQVRLDLGGRPGAGSPAARADRPARLAWRRSTRDAERRRTASHDACASPRAARRRARRTPVTWVRGGGLDDAALPAADAARLRGVLVVPDRAHGDHVAAAHEPRAAADLGRARQLPRGARTTRCCRWRSRTPPSSPASR